MARNHTETKSLDAFVNGDFDKPREDVVADVALLARNKQYGLLLAAYDTLQDTLGAGKSTYNTQQEAEALMREFSGEAASVEESRGRIGYVIPERVNYALSAGNPVI